MSYVYTGYRRGLLSGFIMIEGSKIQFEKEFWEFFNYGKRPTGIECHVVVVGFDRGVSVRSLFFFQTEKN